MKCNLCKQFFKKYPPQKDIDNTGRIHKIEQSHSMSEISCYFDGDHNWDCQTINKIRDICYEGQDLPNGVDYQYCEDQKYATIKVDEIGINAKALWVTWYKNRGRTDAMWLLDSYEKPRKPTKEECLKIIDYYEKER